MTQPDPTPAPAAPTRPAAAAPTQPAPAAAAPTRPAAAAAAGLGRPNPKVSVIIPVYHEGEAIIACLERIGRDVLLPAEILIVHDTEDDTTIPHAHKAAQTDPRIRTLHNTYGPGPANAIRYGIDHATAPIAVVTMADGCDDPRQIDELARLVDRGVVVAAASRYMPGGQQVGGPRLKRLLSRWAGRTLHWFARVGTRDATNSFKAYDTHFVRTVGIESRTGFEIGLELTAKATRLRLPVAEIPTIWLDRQLGTSHFDLGRFLPSYLRWYTYSYGRRLTPHQLTTHHNPPPHNPPHTPPHNPPHPPDTPPAPAPASTTTPASTTSTPANHS